MDTANTANTDFSPQQLQALTQAVMQHLDDWQISSEDTLTLLGLTEVLKLRQLNGLRNGERSLPQTAEVMLRVDHVIGIADALRTTFPFSSQMRLLWLRKPHRRFQRRTPLLVMLSEGINGLQRVRIEVDCAYGYAIDEALRAAAQRAVGSDPDPLV